jgi:hypothetical protein
MYGVRGLAQYESPSDIRRNYICTGMWSRRFCKYDLLCNVALILFSQMYRVIIVVHKYSHICKIEFKIKMYQSKEDTLCIRCHLLITHKHVHVP